MNISDLCELEVVSLVSGVNLGRIDDVSFDEANAFITDIVLYGRYKLFGLLGREEDTSIPWSNIVKIGEDVILVKDEITTNRKRRRFFGYLK